jgi:hypothetical protein
VKEKPPSAKPTIPTRMRITPMMVAGFMCSFQDTFWIF